MPLVEASRLKDLQRPFELMSACSWGSSVLVASAWHAENGSWTQGCERDGRGPVTELSVDGARPSVNPRQERQPAVAKYGLASMWSPHRSLRSSWQHFAAKALEVVKLNSPQRLWRPKAASSHSPRWAGCGSVWQVKPFSGASSRLLGWRTCSIPLNWFAVRVPCPSLRRWTKGCERQDARNHMPGLVERVHCQGWKLNSQGQVPDLGRNGQRILQEYHKGSGCRTLVQGKGCQCRWSSATLIATWSLYSPLRCWRSWWLGATLLRRPRAAFKEQMLVLSSWQRFAAVLQQKLREEHGWTSCCGRHPMHPWSCFWIHVAAKLLICAAQGCRCCYSTADAAAGTTMVSQHWCWLL